jgi:hypothetical protein
MNGADCGGATWMVYCNAGLPYTRESTHTFPSGINELLFQQVENPMAGDIVLWRRHHMMIYQGDFQLENGGQIFDGWSTRESRNQYFPANTDWWTQQYGTPEYYRYVEPEH